MPDDSPTVHPAEIAAEATLPIGAVSAAELTERPFPTSIGRYRIVRLLGEGGMGAVYESEQGQPRRRVAVKVIKAAWASPELLRRFAQESQVLGRLHHAGIALRGDPRFGALIAKAKERVAAAEKGK